MKPAIFNRPFATIPAHPNHLKDCSHWNLHAYTRAFLYDFCWLPSTCFRYQIWVQHTRVANSGSSLRLSGCHCRKSALQYSQRSVMKMCARSWIFGNLLFWEAGPQCTEHKKGFNRNFLGPFNAKSYMGAFVASTTSVAVRSLHALASEVPKSLHRRNQTRWM